MTEQRAREILGSTARDDGRLLEGMPFVRWHPLEKLILLDGEFSADEVEAMAWWMRNMKAGA
jgi:hypothetical protein